MAKKTYLVLFGLALTLVGIILIFERCKPHTNDSSAGENTAVNAEYVGDKTCVNCHAKQYADWKKSDHYMAMLPASDSTVLGDFNDVTYTSNGVTSNFFRKDGKYFINTEGPDGINQDYEVLYTFGYKPLQQYLVAFPNGKMQVPRLSWDVKQKKWFNQYPGQKIYHGNWLHWTKGGQNWNTMCASCHSTNLQKNYFAEQDSFHTTYHTINVSCETCHGPASKHVKFVQSDEYKKGKHVAGSFLRKISDSTNLALINTCAPCHARKSDLSQSPVASNEIMDNYIPEIPTTEFFYADGQAREEDYIYTSFLQSKMFTRGVRCNSCHNPHSGNILYVGNQLCLQCHEKKYDSFDHTHHQQNLVQSECVSCHMPGKIYMGVDMRQDHTFRVPRPDLSAKYGTPNACASCHKDKTNQWLSDAVVKWFGPTRKYHFAEDLIPGSQLNANSEAHLTKLLSDTAVPFIVKSAAIHYLGSILTPNSLKIILDNLTDANAQIRYRAVTSLASFPFENWRDRVGPLLSDKVKAVRIASANLFITIPSSQIPEAFQSAFASAKNELQNYLQSQLDFPVGNVMLADYYLKQKDYFNAEKYYVRGLEKDSLMNYARFNLASAYNASNDNQSALKVLETAAKTDPQNERVFYNLALLQVEMKNIPEAMKNFDKAVTLKTENPRVYYNYGLLLEQNGNAKKAELILQKGIGLSPDDADLNYALALMYIKQGEVEKAKKPAAVLKRVDPANPNYATLFRATKV
ncbi:MAG: hypothetical protein C5B52_04175 [Bacteroidetes bacterium]|nr:MAG: hypothetical protein C5B52_04175 [Bacteroidota bacterium]